MSKYSEMIALLEYLDKARQPQGPPDKKPEKSLMQQVMEAQAEFDAWSKWKADQEKLGKKEDKKEEKKGWDKLSFIQKVTILTATVPLATMGYILIALAFAKAVARLVA